jgi:hypothetical protein
LQKTTSFAAEASTSEALLNFSHAQPDDENIPRYWATLVPSKTTGASFGRATLIASRKPYVPNHTLLLGWRARQDSSISKFRFAAVSTTTRDRNEASGNRMQNYTTLLRRDGPYAPMDDIARRTGALLSDLDMLMRQYQA